MSLDLTICELVYRLAYALRVSKEPRRQLAENPVQDLLTICDHMPTIAKPWHVTDMKVGEPTRLVREDHDGNAVATIRRTGRKAFRWCAWAGVDVIVPPASEHVEWSTLDEAQTACDEALRERGVVVMGGE